MKIKEKQKKIFKMERDRNYEIALACLCLMVVSLMVLVNNIINGRTWDTSLWTVAPLLLDMIAFTLLLLRVIRLREKMEGQIEEAYCEAVRMEDLRNQVILDAMDVLYFEWDLGCAQVQTSTKWWSALGYTPTPEMIENGSMVEEREALSFQGMVMMILGGQEFAEEEFRFIYGDGQSHWSRIRLVGIQDDGGETRRIIGIISDIEDQKCRENNLVDHARRDPLTGAFNKKAVREEIETLLLLSSFRQGSSHCLLLIDIDDFKKVNDHFGHAYGDQILMELVKSLTEIFRASDIVGRIGGDEFIVLMKELREADDVTARARHVLRRVSSIRLPDGSPLGCSIGIACFPRDGTDFETLYSHGDQAMYHAKELGKNGFACYGEEVQKKTVSQVD